MKWVYFIKPIGMDGPIKIGCSRNPDGRRDNLDTWSPFALEVVASIEGDHTLERRLHARFVSSHERREWFRATPDLLAAIEQIKAGTFDLEQLPDPLFVANFEFGKSRKRDPWFGQQMSYSLRVGAMERRSGFSCPVAVYGMIRDGDQERIAAADAFLRDPARHGEIRNEYAEERRAEWIAAHASPQVPA